MISDVKAGRLSRRTFVQTMIGLGLTAPLAAQMLASAGVAQAQPKAPAFTPTRRGGGGLLKTLWWQAPALLNPHFATGTKDGQLETAEGIWRACLATGEMKAHFGLGHTLLDLDRPFAPAQAAASTSSPGPGGIARLRFTNPHCSAAARRMPRATRDGYVTSAVPNTRTAKISASGSASRTIPATAVP